MNKFRVYLGYAIGCAGALISGLTVGHLAALRKYAPDEIVELGCKDGDLLKTSYPKYVKNVLKDVIELYRDVL